MTKRIEVPTPTSGYGWVGAWRDGPIGWWLPNFLHRLNRRGHAEEPNPELERYRGAPNRVFLCKITIEPMLTQARLGTHGGRPITRIVKSSEEG